jgi:DNA-binding MarR family transcriptional regulator
MTVTRGPLPVTPVPDDVLLDHRIGPAAFRLYVFLHAETQAHLLPDEDAIAAALGYPPRALLRALRELEAAGYVLRRFDRDWQVVR